MPLHLIKWRHLYRCFHSMWESMAIPASSRSLQEIFGWYSLLSTRGDSSDPSPLPVQFADWNHDKMVAENATSTRELTMVICNEETPPTSDQKLLPFLPMTFIGSASGPLRPSSHCSLIDLPLQPKTRVGLSGTRASVSWKC
jgi:hypothetical protein